MPLHQLPLYSEPFDLPNLKKALHRWPLAARFDKWVPTKYLLLLGLGELH